MFKTRFFVQKALDRRGRITDLQLRLPMEEVVRPLLGRLRPAVARGEIFQKFDPRPGRGPKRGNPKACSEDIVQMFLLDSMSLTMIAIC